MHVELWWLKQGKAGGLYQVVQGSLTSESRSKGDVGTKQVDIQGKCIPGRGDSEAMGQECACYVWKLQGWCDWDEMCNGRTVVRSGV